MFCFLLTMKFLYNENLYVQRCRSVFVSVEKLLIIGQISYIVISWAAVVFAKISLASASSSLIFL